MREAGHDVDYVGERPSDPGDEAILPEALRGGRILITRDKDFGFLAVQVGSPHCGILQLRRMPLRDQAHACLLALERHAGDLLAGAIVTVLPGRVRIRRSGGR